MAQAMAMAMAMARRAIGVGLIALLLGITVSLAAQARPKTAAAGTTSRAAKRIVFIAGARSHGYGEHDHNAGCRLLAAQLEAAGLGITAVVYYPGWPRDPHVFDGADAVVFYADGALRHPVLPHLAEVDALAKKGVGVGLIHFAAEIAAGEPGQKLIDWTGGYFEQRWSVSTFWTPQNVTLAKHPITEGVHPFSTLDEWYFHMRFAPPTDGVTPILSAVVPPNLLAGNKDGTHGGNPAVRAEIAAGAPQTLMWARQRAEGGRGFGFTGGHVHWHWAHPDQRQLVVNAIAWIAKIPIPKGGVLTSAVTMEDLEKDADEPITPKFDRAKTAQLVEAIKQTPRQP